MFLTVIGCLSHHIPHWYIGSGLLCSKASVSFVSVTAIRMIAHYSLSIDPTHVTSPCPPSQIQPGLLIKDSRSRPPSPLERRQTLVLLLERFQVRPHHPSHPHLLATLANYACMSCTELQPFVLHLLFVTGQLYIDLQHLCPALVLCWFVRALDRFETRIPSSTYGVEV